MTKRIKIFLYFPPEQTEKPLIHHLIKEYDLMINILQAEVKQGKRGKLTADFKGDDKSLQNALTFLDSLGVKYKIFTKSIIWHENKCIHCGACTAVCPSRALSMNPDNWNLSFNHDKCLLCELCIPACPVNAIDKDFSQ